MCSDDGFDVSYISLFIFNTVPSEGLELMFLPHLIPSSHSLQFYTGHSYGAELFVLFQNGPIVLAVVIHNRSA